VENRDIVLDVVWTSGDPDQAVTEAIQRGAEMLIPCGSSASVAAKRQAAPTLPIVFLNVGNPIAMGLVENLSHPNGNALQQKEGRRAMASWPPSSCAASSWPSTSHPAR